MEFTQEEWRAIEQWYFLYYKHNKFGPTRADKSAHDKLLQLRDTVLVELADNSLLADHENLITNTEVQLSEAQDALHREIAALQEELDKYRTAFAAVKEALDHGDDYID